jgi:signal transduction histidine kinase
MKSMHDSNYKLPPNAQNIHKQFENEFRKKFIIIASCTYLILAVFSFIGLNLFSKYHLIALINSQSNSIAIQEWRTVTNGIYSGWNLPYQLDCISIMDENKNIIADQGNCYNYKDTNHKYLGQSFNYKINQFHIKSYVKYSIWIIAFLLPLFIFIFFVILYFIFKISTRFENKIEIINFFDQYDKNMAQYSNIQQLLHEKTEEIIKLKKNAAIAEIASQVSHDIRSPLAALSMVTKDLTQIPEEQRIIIRASLNRITDIANDLLDKNRKLNSTESQINENSLMFKESDLFLLSSLLETIVSEKRIQFRSKMNINIEFNPSSKSYGLFAKIDPKEFKRIISNLINNSVEALGDRGSVNIHLFPKEDTHLKSKFIVIKISDNGAGISPEVLAKIGSQGTSYGKVDGNGLGLYHAIKTIESWGGNFKIDSTVGSGTKIILEIPMSDVPYWFIEKLDIKPSSTIVFLDDDSTIHKIWDKRFHELQKYDFPLKLFHFSSSDEFEKWFELEKNNSANNFLFLFDFELLNDKTNGLSLIEKHQLNSNNLHSILVTSRFEEKRILEKCAQLKVKMIPKSMAEIVPIGLTQ